MLVFCTFFLLMYMVYMYNQDLPFCFIFENVSPSHQAQEDDGWHTAVMSGHYGQIKKQLCNTIFVVGKYSIYYLIICYTNYKKPGCTSNKHFVHESNKCSYSTLVISAGSMHLYRHVTHLILLCMTAVAGGVMC